MRYRLRTLPSNAQLLLAHAIGFGVALVLVWICKGMGIVQLTDGNENPINLSHWIGMMIVAYLIYMATTVVVACFLARKATTSV